VEIRPGIRSDPLDRRTPGPKPQILLAHYL